MLGPAPTLTQAIAAAQTEPLHTAVLDINLGGSLAWPVMDLLLARSVAVTLVSGYDAASVPARYAHLPRWAKPVGMRELARQFAAPAAEFG